MAAAICDRLQWLFYFQVSATDNLRVLEKLPLPVIFFARNHKTQEGIANAKTFAVTRMLSCIDKHDAGQKITIDALIKLHKRLTLNKVKPGLRRAPIAVKNPLTNLVDFVPPLPSAMGRYLDTLLELVNGSDPSLQRSALLLHRLVHIHPFCDGNGRLSRALGACGLSFDKRLIWFGQCLYFMQHAKSEYIPALAELRNGRADAYRHMIASSIRHAAELVKNTLADVQAYVNQVGHYVALAFVDCPVLSLDVLVNRYCFPKSDMQKVINDLLQRQLLTQAEIDGQDCLIAEPLIANYNRVRLPRQS